MNSLRPAVANCSSQIAGYAPVSQRSNAMSFASCHRGDTKCTSAPNSSKQNKKKRCGYQCRQKCQNLCVNVGQPFLLAPSPAEGAVRSGSVIGEFGFGVQTLACARHNTAINSATSACTLSNPRRSPTFPSQIPISP